MKGSEKEEEVRVGARKGKGVEILLCSVSFLVVGKKVGTCFEVCSSTGLFLYICFVRCKFKNEDFCFHLMVLVVFNSDRLSSGYFSRLSDRLSGFSRKVISFS